MWSSQGGHDCVSHRKGLPGVGIVTYPASVPLARSIARVSLAIRSSSPRSHREADGLFYPHSYPTSQASLLRLTVISASISASPGITCTRRKTHARVQNNEFRSQRLIGRIVALAGLSLSFPLAPGCSRGTNHPPHRPHTTHTPRRTTLFSRSSSSLVVLHIPNTPSRYTSTDPLLRTQSQVIQ